MEHLIKIFYVHGPLCLRPFFHRAHHNFMQTLDSVSKKSVRINHIYCAGHDDLHLLSTDTPISLRVPINEYTYCCIHSIKTNVINPARQVVL